LILQNGRLGGVDGNLNNMTPEQLQIFLKHNDEATAKAIELHVNGKIRVLREEQNTAHKELKNEIQAVADSVKEVLETFKDTSTFFKVIINISKFLIPVASAWGIIWGIIKIFNK